MQNLKFSISLPVYNSARYLKQCLETLESQDYPKELIEVLVVDGGSIDSTMEIARRYNVKVFPNPKRLGEYGMQIAVREAHGDLLILFAADNGLVGNDWLKRVAAIFSADNDLSCIWGRMIADKTDPKIMHYYELIQSEPLAHFLNKNLQSYLSTAALDKCAGLKYQTFIVDPKRPLCWGANGIVYRMADVKDLFLGEQYVGDNEVFQYMVERGKHKVAYARDLNIYHHTVLSVADWVKKWKRNYTQIFLKTRHERRIDWFYDGNFKMKMCLWLIYSLIPVFSITHAIYLAVRDRNIYWLYHPLMCFLQSITYLYWTIVLPEGRHNLVEHIFKK